MSDKSYAVCGTFNTETGESQVGYMENGEMKYKDPSLWYTIKKFFGLIKPHAENVSVLTRTETKYAGICTWIGGKQDAIYEVYNVDTQKIIAVYTLKTGSGGQRIYINIDAWVRDKVCLGI
jgi:hypothetical protein